MPQDAVLLMAVVIGLYIYDSALLLRRDEGVLVPARRGRWSVELGSQSYQLLGKYVFIPNPFLPHRPLYRAAWRLDGDHGVQEDWDARRNVLRPIAPLVGAMAVAFFVLLPLGFFTKAGNWALVAALALLYLSIVTTLVWVWRHRSTFMLSGKQYAALAFESLVCSPFALNMVRRLSAHMPALEDLVNASCRLQMAGEWPATRARLVARLDEAIELEEEGSERMAGLLEHRRRMTER